MNRVITLFLVVVCVACAVAAQKPLSPPKFLQFNVPGCAETDIQAINDSAIMVGTAFTPGTHCVVIVGKTVTVFDYPGADETLCTGINSLGVIVGTYAKGPKPTAFIYQDGKFSDVGVPQGVGWGINGLGDVVGSFTDASGMHGFLWNGTTYQTLDVPGATRGSQAMGINDQGLVTLEWFDDSNANGHASLYDGTNYTNIDVPGAFFTVVGNINNLGDIVLTWEDQLEVDHGAVLHDGKYYSFAAPNASHTEGLGINDKDVVVGILRSKDGTFWNYKMIP